MSGCLLDPGLDRLRKFNCGSAFVCRQESPLQGLVETADQSSNTAVTPACKASLVGDQIVESEEVGAMSLWKCVSEVVLGSRSRCTK